MIICKNETELKEKAFSLGYNYAKQKVAKDLYLVLSVLKTKIRRKGLQDEADELERAIEKLLK